MALHPLRPGDPPGFGPYRLHGRLGSGGMGVVYLAFGPDGEAAAVKVLQPVLAEDDEYRARFVREVSAACLVDSPYVARMLAAETTTEPLWMATEYIEGPTLAQAVASNGPVPADRTEGLAFDLASALVALHSVGLVHRDLKPENIVLSWRGPKIIDFGIAKQEHATDLTRTGFTVGSLQWLSPEVLAGVSASRASDIFAWGLCVAFASTGRPPFGEGNPSAVAYRITQAEPDLQGLPPGLLALVSAALAKDPMARPSGPDLCAALGGRALQPTAVAPPQQGGWSAAPPAPGASPTRGLPPQEPEPRRRSRLALPLVLTTVLLIAAAAAIVLVAISGGGKQAPVAHKSILPSGSVSPTASASVTPSASASASPTASPSVNAAHNAAVALDRLLTDSSQSRANVVAAVSSAQSCDDPGGAAQTLTAAGAERETELQRLQRLDLSALAGGGHLTGVLTDALTSSRTADLSFAAWANGAVGCSGSAPQDANFQAASAASNEATQAKQEFVNLWNPIAASNGLATREVSGI